jgi:hypothetical protein
LIREANVKSGNGIKEPVFRFEVEEKLTTYPNYYV